MRCTKLILMSLKTCSRLCQEKCLMTSKVPQSYPINSQKKSFILSKRVSTRTKTEKSLLSKKKKLNLLRSTTKMARETRRTTRMARNSSTRARKTVATKARKTIRARSLTRMAAITARRMVREDKDLEASVDLVAPLTRVKRDMVPNMMVNARCPGTRSRCVMAASKDKTSTRDLSLPSSKRIQCSRALTVGCSAVMK